MLAKKNLLFYLLACITLPSFLSAAGIDLEQQSITLALTSEPPSLDSSTTTDTVSSLILLMVNDGLVITDRRGQPAPGMAYRWVIDDQRATFYLRDALWSDGKPVTAHDFVYAFQRLVDPKTGGGGSTFFAYILQNATLILAGKAPVESLGVRAVDDKTLELTLSQPVPYLLTIMGFVQYLPLRQDFVEAQQGRYGADAENLLFNGPFMLERWTHSASLLLTRNPHYWQKDKIQLERIDYGYITSDVRSLLNLYTSGELAAMRLNEETLKDALNSQARVKKAPTNCLSWIMMNMRPERITHHLKLREAIRLALDRETYANKIVGLPGTRLIDSIFTRRMIGVSRSFQAEFPTPEIDYNPTKARQLVESLKSDLNLDALPPIVMLINETRQIEAEYVQSQLMTKLDLDVRVDKQTFKQSLVKFRQGNFDLARSGFCGGALRDPVLFAGIFESSSAFNDMAFKDPRYDELMAITHSTADPSTRMQAFNEMQQILYRQVPIIPTHESAWVYLQNPGLKNIVRYPVVDFSRGTISGQAP